MDLIRAGLGLSKTIRNVGRLQEIVLVFARHGFDEFITNNVTTKIPNFVLPKSKKRISEELANKSEKDWNQVLGFRLRKCFEELGPAFIKFGQLLSSREDLFHPSFLEEMRMLRDKVKTVPLADVLPAIEKSLGKKIDQVFSYVDPIAIGTASIGVVYRAVLLDGTPVVIKVRRPGIEKEIETDFSIIMFLATQAERVSKELRYLGVTRVLNDFAFTLQRELNFNIEALNCERLKKNLEKHDEKKLYYIPKVYKEFSTEDILVIEELKGIPFSSNELILEKKDEIIPKMEYGVQLFLKTFLKDGFFHADLHGGNFFYLLDGVNDGRIGLIDFGLMGSLSKNGRHHFIAIVYALLSYNYENLVYEFLDVAEYDTIPDIDGLIRDVREGLSPFVGLSVKQTNFSDLLTVVLNTLKKHQIFLPREWYIIFRALITIDGVGKDLGIDLNIFGILEGDINEIVQSTFNKEELMEEAAWAARDLTSSLRVLPRHIRWFLRDFAKKGYAIEVKNTGYEKELVSLVGALIFLGFSLVAGIFIFSGIFIIAAKEIHIWSDIPTLSWILWSLGLLLFSSGIGSLKKV
ncbi:MAG: AarF/UbiB family protein [Bacteriovorax sp.]|nr:AarF/UbiB family protein [Bacteriovorax sp.]